MKKSLIDTRQQPPGRPTVEQLRAKYAAEGFSPRFGVCVPPETKAKIRAARFTGTFEELTARFGLPTSIIMEVCRGVQHYRPTRSVVCREEPDRRFVNVGHAADEMGVTRNAIQVSIDAGQACCGLHFRYLDVPEDQCPPIKPGREQRVIFHGQEYPSISALVRMIPCPRSRKPSAHWEWVRRNAQRIGQRKDWRHVAFEERAKELMGEAFTASRPAAVA